MGGVGFRSMSEMAIFTSYSCRVICGRLPAQTEDKEWLPLHDCGVMKYTRSLGQSRIPDNA